MQRTRQAGDPGGGCVLSIGNFDGFHRGHRKVVGACLEKSRELGAPGTVLTFEPHPLEVLNPDRAPRRIATPRVRAELLEAFGVDRLVEHPFNEELAGCGLGRCRFAGSHRDRGGRYQRDEVHSRDGGGVHWLAAVLGHADVQRAEEQITVAASGRDVLADDGLLIRAPRALRKREFR